MRLRLPDGFLLSNFQFSAAKTLLKILDGNSKVGFDEAGSQRIAASGVEHTVWYYNTVTPTITMKLQFLLLALGISLLQTGCAIGRRTVALPVPTTGAATQIKGAFYIGAITDARDFQNKPADPATPSVDGDVNALSAEQKGVMIGRQRNTYGRAMGDIALPADDSVIKRARLLVEETLKHRGYQISSDPGVPNSASISIDEFWAWFTPGFWSVSFEARVYCTITVKKPDGSVKLVIKGYGINRGQVASDANWQLAYDLAFRDFLSKLDAELDKVGY